MAATLCYAPNSRIAEARKVLDGRLVHWREPKYFAEAESRVAGEPVGAVVLLAGSPSEAEIAERYRAAGVRVEVVGDGVAVEPAPEQTRSERPSDPWPASMRLAPDQYAERFPSGPNADLARAWVRFLAENEGEELWRG